MYVYNHIYMDKYLNEKYSDEKAGDDTDWDIGKGGHLGIKVDDDDGNGDDDDNSDDYGDDDGDNNGDGDNNDTDWDIGKGGHRAGQWIFQRRAKGRSTLGWSRLWMEKSSWRSQGLWPDAGLRFTYEQSLPIQPALSP